MITLQGIPVIDPVIRMPLTDEQELSEALRAWRWICVRRYGLAAVVGAAKRHAEMTGLAAGAWI